MASAIGLPAPTKIQQYFQGDNYSKAAYRYSSSKYDLDFNFSPSTTSRPESR